MQITEKTVELRLDEFKKEGLYLMLKSGNKLELTHENIEKVTTEFWEDENKIPSHLKQAIDFKRCDICPIKNRDDLCNAIRPVLPLLEILDDFVSHDEVVAIYKGKDRDLLHIADTTMQDALKFISILSLTGYCQLGRKYRKYFLGIILLMDAKQVAIRLYLNIYQYNQGNKETVDKTINCFKEDMTMTSKNQLKRLNLICKNDAFLNAIVNTQLATQLLTMDMESMLETAYTNFK